MGLAIVLAFGLFALTFSLTLVTINWAAGAPWFFQLFGAAFVLMGAGLVAYAVWALWVRGVLIARYLGPAQASLSATRLRLGDRLTIQYEQPVRRDVNLGSAAVQLLLRETATYRRGTNTYTVTHDNVVAERVAPGRHLTAGSTIAETCTFQIPLDSMHTFEAPRNKLRWVVRIRAQIPGAPDLSEELALVVAPVLAEEGHRADPV